MRAAEYSLFILLVLSLCVSFLNAQQANSSSTSATVPRLVNFSGRATDVQGRPIAGTATVTFAIYKDQYEGPPQWMETQNVHADAKGNYSVPLGATKSEGLPLELFSSGDARWLGVRVNGEDEQPRVLLLSVPYALKAADAQTLGGLPPTAFMMAAQSATSTVAASSSESAGDNAGTAPQPIGGSGTQNYLPLWTDNNGTLGNSVFYQVGSGASARIGLNLKTPLATLDINGTTLIRGTLEPVTKGFATASRGFNSNPLDFEASSFSSSTQKAVMQHFEWQAEPTGNNTNAPGATLSLLFGQDDNKPTETGLKLSNKGLFTFAPGQAFPGTGSITGVTAGTDLTGGGNSGNVTLSVDTTQVPQLNTSNTFTQPQTVSTTTFGAALTATSNSIQGIVGIVTANGLGNSAIQGAATATGSNQTFGVVGTSAADNGIGVYGLATGASATAVLGNASGDQAVGVEGNNSSGSGVEGNSISGTGVFGRSQTGYGIYADSGAGTAVYGSGNYFAGQFVGKDGSAAGGVLGVGGAGTAGGGTGGAFYGGYSSDGTGGDGIFAELGSGTPCCDFTYAGYFVGSIDVIGNVYKSGGSFKIDHPLDPANKYLYHSFVESPDMKNVYDGNAVLDGKGSATIQLPEWFETLNSDFRYQLTAIGTPGPNLYVAEEISGNHFRIAGGTPGSKVSWQVTGIRQDAWANAHRIPVEEPKPERERGFYLHPELFGAPEEKKIPWVRHPEARRVREGQTKPATTIKAAAPVRP